MSNPPGAPTPDWEKKVVWETAGAGLSWKKTGTVNAAVVTTKKPGMARYLGSSYPYST